MTDLDPATAVAVARQAADPAEAADRLDRYLRSALLDYLQNRRGERDTLSAAFLEAQIWAKRQMEAFFERWTFLLQLLEDSRLVASTAEQVEMLTQREEDVMRQLVHAVLAEDSTGGLRPRELAQRLDISEQNLNNYLRRLESQGLLVRHRVPGQRAVLVFPTRRGLALAEQLNLSSHPETESREVVDEAPRQGSRRRQAVSITPWPKPTKPSERDAAPSERDAA